MFKSVILTVILALAITSASHLYELDNNIIHYEDTPIQGMLPYPYHDNRMEFIEPIVRYEPVNVPVHNVVTDVVATKTGLISSVVSNLLSLVASAISFISKNIKALVFGSISAISLCKFTPICSELLAINSLSEVSRGFTSFVTPERIKRASEFVREAIEKYRALQRK